jgi:hypothetical protein
MNVLACPGAEGPAALVTAGRGGKLVRITTTADNESGPGIPGSIREFAKMSGPRIGVFDFPAGTDARINNLRPLIFDKPDFRLCGQTALGQGVTLSGEETRFQTYNFLVEHVRLSRGDQQDARDGFQNADAANTGDPDAGGAYLGLFKNCSFRWAIDETFTLWYQTHDMTVQDCLLTEGLYRSRHPEGPHSMGFLVGAPGTGISSRISLIRTFMSNFDQRVPQITACQYFDMRNCFAYNWKTHAAEFKELGNIVNMLGNYYQAGPDTDTSVNPSFIGVDVSAGDMQLCIEGNIGPTITNPLANNWPAVRAAANGAQVPATGHQLATPFATPNTNPYMPAEDAKAYVLAHAGCMRPVRDSHDARVVAQVATNTGRVIDSQSQVGGWPTYTAKASLQDSDSDGMPDAWEDSHGTNKVFAADANEVRSDQGWTNLEIYLAELAQRDFVPPTTTRGGFFQNWLNLFRRRRVSSPPPYRM